MVFCEARLIIKINEEDRAAPNDKIKKPTQNKVQ